MYLESSLCPSQSSDRSSPTAAQALSCSEALSSPPRLALPLLQSSQVVEESSDCQLPLHSVQMVRAEPLSPKASRCYSQLGSTYLVAMWASLCAFYAVCDLFFHHKCLVLLLFYKWGIGNAEKANNMPKVSWLGDGGTRIQSQICPVLNSIPMSSIPRLPQWLGGI